MSAVVAARPGGGGAHVAGMLLTGGSSSRMGTDKAALRVGDETLALRTGRLLVAACAPVVEVGPGRSGLTCTLEEPPGTGPLAAIGAGWRVLRAAAGPGAALLGALVVSCDLPLLDEQAVALLANWPGTGSFVPVLEGRAQPLCARWSAADLDAVEALVAAGHRGLGPLLGRAGIELGDEAVLGVRVRPSAFADADTPGDLARLLRARSAPTLGEARVEGCAPGGHYA